MSVVSSSTTAVDRRNLFELTTFCSAVGEQDVVSSTRWRFELSIAAAMAHEERLLVADAAETSAPVSCCSIYEGCGSHHLVDLLTGTSDVEYRRRIVYQSSTDRSPDSSLALSCALLFARGV